MSIRALSVKQKKLLEFIKSYSNEHFCSPTHREIRKALNTNSSAHVNRMLDRLEKLKFIKRGSKRTKRNIELSHSPCSILIRGEIVGGQAIKTFVLPKEILLTHKLFGKNHYLIKVKSDSMIDENICYGDLIICEKCQKIPDGTAVITLINKREVTLKKIYYKKDKIYLKSIKTKHNAQIYNPQEIEVQGKFAGLIRFMP